MFKSFENMLNMISFFDDIVNNIFNLRYIQKGLICDMIGRELDVRMKIKNFKHIDYKFRGLYLQSTILTN